MNANETTEDFLARMIARPKTHAVVATYESGKVYSFECASLGAAKNHATTWERKIGKSLISRETGETVRVISVVILPL